MEPAPDLPIEHRDPRTLTPHPENYRSHPDAQVEAIAQNISDLGMYSPVVIDTQDRILAGHGVTLGCISLQLETIPVYVFEGTEAAAKRLMVADNELSRGAEDSEEALAALLGEVAESYGDLRGTGWSKDALEELVAEIDAGDDFDPDAVEFPEYDENIDTSGIRYATCPECGHEFPV